MHIRIHAERMDRDIAPAAPMVDAPPQVRSFYIRRSDITQHGYSYGEREETTTMPTCIT